VKVVKRKTEWTYRGVLFGGIPDKRVVEENPVAGASAFTVEVCFRPDAGGEAEQRFLHIQGDDGSRALLELRSGEAGWYGDVFVQLEAGNRFLNDPALVHPFGHWYTMALVYTGKELRQYVNGVLELAGAAPRGMIGPGRTSIGARLNDISPFTGEIAQIRFTLEALEAASLMLPDE